MFPPENFQPFGPCSPPRAGLHGVRKSYADPRYCHLANTQSAIALLPRGIRASGSRIGGAEQSVRRHGDRIGGGLAERFDHAMAFGLQRSNRLVCEAALDPHFVRKPLMVQA